MKTIIISLALLAASASAHAQSSEVSVSQLQASVGPNGISDITGVASNQSGRLLSETFLKFNLYDDQGNVVGNTITHASNLAPGDQWKFDAQTPTRFSRFKLTEVQVYPSVR